MANTFSAWVSLSDKTFFLQGDATNLPFPTDHFNGAVTVHVAMNIRDKVAVYAEARRVLKLNPASDAVQRRLGFLPAERHTLRDTFGET